LSNRGGANERERGATGFRNKGRLYIQYNAYKKTAETPRGSRGGDGDSQLLRERKKKVQQLRSLTLLIPEGLRNSIVRGKIKEKHWRALPPKKSAEKPRKREGEKGWGRSAGKQGGEESKTFKKSRH